MRNKETAVEVMLQSFHTKLLFPQSNSQWQVERWDLTVILRTRGDQLYCARLQFDDESLISVCGESAFGSDQQYSVISVHKKRSKWLAKRGKRKRSSLRVICKSIWAKRNLCRYWKNAIWKSIGEQQQLVNLMSPTLCRCRKLPIFCVQDVKWVKVIEKEMISC